MRCNATHHSAPQFRRHAASYCGLAEKMQHGSSVVCRKLLRHRLFCDVFIIIIIIIIIVVVVEGKTLAVRRVALPTRNKCVWRNSDVTYHVVTWDVTCSDTEGGILVVLVSVNGKHPVVDSAREADGTQHDAVVETAASRRHVVVGEENVVVGGRRVQTEPCHCRHYRDRPSNEYVAAYIPTTQMCTKRNIRQRQHFNRK